MTSNAHSNLSPSGAKRWINCAGSVTLESLAPKLPTSEFAAEGTVAHMLAEQFASGGLNTEQLMAKLGTVVKQDGHEIEIIDDMIDGALEYHDLISDYLNALDVERGVSPVVHAFEARVCAQSVSPELWGTADFYAYKKGRKLVIIDYKFGKGVVVDAEENEQAAIYAIGVMDTIKCWAFDEVEIVIHQPRAPHVDGTIRTWKTTVEWLTEFRDFLIEKAKNTRDPLAPLNAGDWCRWCRARPGCPEIHGAVQREAKADFSLVPPEVPGNNAATRVAARLPEVRLLPVAVLARALAWEDAINSWFEAVKDVVREKLSVGEDVPGYKLVEGRSNRQWVDEAAVVAEFEPVLGEEKLYEKKLLSPAKLEKVVGKGKLEHLTFKPEGKKAIAPDRDPRPVAKSSAKEDFAPVDPLLGELATLVDPLAREPMWPA